jgi:4-hydroxybenzoate polyprenyltransferase
MMRVSAFCAVVLSVLSVGTAQAATGTASGYVCTARYTPQPNLLYGQGYVTVNLYTGAGCTGSLVGSYVYLGAEASAVGYTYTEAAQLQLFERATVAATQGTRVSLNIETTHGAINHTTYLAN